MIRIGTDQEALRQLMRKERLTEPEAARLFSSIDRRLFVEQLISLLRYRHFLTDDEILAVFSPSRQSAAAAAISPSAQDIPISILANEELSALESVCRYLREKGLRYSEIAKLLNRDQRTIWVTCRNSVKKRKEPLPAESSGPTFPLGIFQDRKLSVLESIVHYLKDAHHLRYSEIAKLINRDERNIWGISSKAEKKLKAS